MVSPVRNAKIPRPRAPQALKTSREAERDRGPGSKPDQGERAFNSSILLQIEDDVRGIATQADLALLAANESRKISKARQVFVFSAQRQLRLDAISGLPAVDRSLPVVRDVERTVSSLGHEHRSQKSYVFDLLDPNNEFELFDSRYPYRAMLWVPYCVRGGEPLGGMLLAREKAWTEQDIVVARRLADIIAHAKALLLAEPRLNARIVSALKLRRWFLAGAVAVLTAVMAIPVPMTTLSPFEIVPRGAFVTAAPIEGVIESVFVHPGAYVKKGQPLVQIADTVLRNRLEISEREIIVSKARLKKASQLAFDDLTGRHELRLAMADQALKTAERDFARDVLNRSKIKSKRSGVALFADRQELIGKPVTLGEKIMRIADPKQVEVAIYVGVSDAIALKRGAKVRLFLDSDPIKPRDATVKFTDYRARPREGGALSYRVVASLTDQEASLPRLGVRGTAKLFGESVPLAFFLLRKPLSTLRQWSGL